MPCKPILIVEDDEDIRDQMMHALEVEGYEVMLAENGKKALGLLTSLTPSQLPGCMILDLMMPEMDGKTLADVMMRDHKDLWGGIRVLIATATSSAAGSDNIPHAMQRIQKPFDLDEFYSAVERHCGKP